MQFVLIKKTDNYLKVFITIAFIFIIIIVINEYKKKETFKEMYNEPSKILVKTSNKSQDKTSSDKTSSDKSNASSIKPFDQTKSYTLGVCSKNCCSTQWKTPVDVTERSKVKSSDVGPGKKYLTSNMTCSNGVIDTGCVCISDETKKMFNNRGFVKEVPISNGLLDADYTISPFTYPKQLNSLDTKDNYYMLSNFSMPIDDNLINYEDIKPIDKFTTEQLMSYPIGISDRS